MYGVSIPYSNYPTFGVGLKKERRNVSIPYSNYPTIAEGLKEEVYCPFQFLIVTIRRISFGIAVPCAIPFQFLIVTIQLGISVCR